MTEQIGHADLDSGKLCPIMSQIISFRVFKFMRQTIAKLAWVLILQVG